MASLTLTGDTSGQVTLAAPAVAGTTTLTLPATTGTVLNDATVGVCRAWVKFTGSGAAVITASFNVSSVTYVSAGTYKVNFTNALSDANYAPVAMAQGYPAVIDGGFTATTSAIQFYVFYASTTGGGQTKFDAPVVGFAAFR